MDITHDTGDTLGFKLEYLSLALFSLPGGIQDEEKPSL